MDEEVLTHFILGCDTMGDRYVFSPFKEVQLEGMDPNAVPVIDVDESGIFLVGKQRAYRIEKGVLEELQPVTDDVETDNELYVTGHIGMMLDAKDDKPRPKAKFKSSGGMYYAVSWNIRSLQTVPVTGCDGFCWLEGEGSYNWDFTEYEPESVSLAEGEIRYLCDVEDIRDTPKDYVRYGKTLVHKNGLIKLKNKTIHVLDHHTCRGFYWYDDTEEVLNYITKDFRYGSVNLKRPSAYIADNFNTRMLHLWDNREKHGDVIFTDLEGNVIEKVHQCVIDFVPYFAGQENMEGSKRQRMTAYLPHVLKLTLECIYLGGFKVMPSNEILIELYHFSRSICFDLMERALDNHLSNQWGLNIEVDWTDDQEFPRVKERMLSKVTDPEDLRMNHPVMYKQWLRFPH